MKNLFLLFIFTTLCTAVLNAQYVFDKDFSPVVLHDDDTLTLAWSGGFNNPQYSNIDIDMDGDNDLFVFDRSGNVPLFFKIDATNSSLQSQVLELSEELPQLKAWSLMVDYNDDGRADIFTHSDSIAGGGISIFKNVGSGSNHEFELIVGLAESFADYGSAAFFSDIYVNLADIPSMIDVDEDGDFDILTFSDNGSELEYHENQSQEEYGDSEHFEFELKNACWGYFKESSLNNDINLFDTCSTNVINPKSYENNSNLHVGSTVLGLDLDDDDVKDLIIGDITGSNLISLSNGGTLQSGIMVDYTNDFPANTVAVDMQVFPSPYYCDINNDGINEMVVAPNAPNTANNFSSVWLYNNVGSNPAPEFEWSTFSFMQDEMIERGSNALPVLFDYNGDDKLDLLIANKSFYHDNLDQISQLALYENTSENGVLSFALVDDDYLNLTDLGLSLALYPTFADMDNDLDEDMILGDFSGQLHYFENSAGLGNVADFNLSMPGITDSDGEVIDVGQFATPFIIDIDRDGKNDMIIGERNGNINYYKNIGSQEVFSFTLENSEFGGIQMPGELDDGFAVPFIIDSDEGYQLFVGSNQGEVVHFFPIEDDLNGTFAVEDDNILSYYEGVRTGVVIADLDDLEGLEMIVGNYRGGLGYYVQGEPIGMNEKEIESLFELYPNPANDQVFLSVKNSVLYNYQIINNVGQIIDKGEAIIGDHTISLNAFDSGSYYIRISLNGEYSFTKPLIIIR